MGEGYNFANFKKAILSLSVSPDWDTAKAEWQLHMVYEDPSDRSCKCEHSPIHQICVIKNSGNSKLAEVGNVCVQKFLRLMSNRIFSVIRRLGSGLVDHSQKMTVAARATAEKKTVGHRS